MHDERITVRFGKADRARDHFRERCVTFAGASGIRVDVVFRCHDDAIAFRYEVPAQDGTDELRLASEATSFRLAGNPVGYVQYLEHHQTAHERAVSTVRAEDLEPGNCSTFR